MHPQRDHRRLSVSDLVPGIRRLCIAIAEDGAGNPAPPLEAILDEACAAADVHQLAHWLPRPVGDELAVFPPGIDEGRVIADFVRELRLVVLRVNDGGPARMRLRVALHQGITRCDEEGYGGRAVVKAGRLRDASVLGRQLAAHPEADLAFIVSAELFDDVAGDDLGHLRRGAFRKVIVPVQGPDPGFLAWVSTSAVLPEPVLVGRH